MQEVLTYVLKIVVRILSDTIYENKVEPPRIVIEINRRFHILRNDFHIQGQRKEALKIVETEISLFLAEKKVSGALAGIYHLQLIGYAKWGREIQYFAVPKKNSWGYFMLILYRET